MTNSALRCVTSTFFEHPVYGVKAIKHGFSWPGFFFPVLWALFHELWLPAFLLLVLGAAAVMMGTSLCHSMLEWEFWWAFSSLVIGVLVGLDGNDWRRWNVSKRGFSYVGTQQAATSDAAVATVIRKRQNDRKNV